MSAEYDFYITKNNRLIIPEQDLDCLLSISESTLPRIAELSEVSVKIAGKDGDLVLASNYEPLDFVLVFYTEDNLTPNQKEEEIVKVTTFLHSIKNSTKKMAFLQGERMYEVKYQGDAIITNFPKFVKFEIPLKSSIPFAMDIYKKRIIGEGYKISKTIQETGCIITINGPTSGNGLRISLNDYQMDYDRAILEGNKLIIDTGNSTVKHINGTTGVITNAAIYYNHEYPKIKYGKDEIKIITGIENEEQVITEWFDLKL